MDTNGDYITFIKQWEVWVNVKFDVVINIEIIDNILRYFVLYFYQC